MKVDPMTASGVPVMGDTMQLSANWLATDVFGGALRVMAEVALHFMESI
jgi:hypothetical protein